MQPLKKLSTQKAAAPKQTAKPQQTKATTAAKGASGRSNGQDVASPINRKLNLGKMPTPPPAEKISGNAIIGDVTLTETSNPARSMMTVPLYYPAEEAEGHRNTFTGRIFVNPDWLDEDFNPETLDEKEAQQYNINFQGKVMKLLRAAFADDPEAEVSLEDLAGRIVGFSTRVRKDDPTQLELGTFFPVKE